MRKLYPGYRKVFNYVFLMIGIGILLSACLIPTVDPPQGLDAAQEVDLEIVWRIPMESPGQSMRGLYFGDTAFFTYFPEDRFITVDLANVHAVNSVYLKESFGSAPVICGDKIFIPNYPVLDVSPKLYMLDLEGELVATMELPEDQRICYFHLWGIGDYLYWISYGTDDANPLFRLDTKAITLDGVGGFSAPVEELYSVSKGMEYWSSPSRYDGKIYFAVRKVGAYENSGLKTWLLVFDEQTGILEIEKELDKWISITRYEEVIRSGETALIDTTVVNLNTYKVIRNGMKTGMVNASPTIIGNSYYASSSGHGGNDFVSLWKLDLETLEVKWYYQHRYSLGTQPQVANGLVFVTGPDLTMLFDAETGELLAKDSQVKGHPVQLANSYLYGDLMIFHDGYYLTAIRTNWRKKAGGGVERF